MKKSDGIFITIISVLTGGIGTYLGVPLFFLSLAIIILIYAFSLFADFFSKHNDEKKANNRHSSKTSFWKLFLGLFFEPTNDTVANDEIDEDNFKIHMLELIAEVMKADGELLSRELESVKATESMQEINEAWDFVKDARGIK